MALTGLGRNGVDEGGVLQEDLHGRNSTAKLRGRVGDGRSGGAALAGRMT
jgi:hypothetical protein